MLLRIKKIEIDGSPCSCWHTDLQNTRLLIPAESHFARNFKLSMDSLQGSPSRKCFEENRLNPIEGYIKEKIINKN